MSEKIQVTTEYLLQKKEEWQNILSHVQSAMAAASQRMESVNDCLDGQAVRECQVRYGKQQKEADLLLDKLGRHIEKLEEIAKVYEAAERSNSAEIGKD